MFVNFSKLRCLRFEGSLQKYLRFQPQTPLRVLDVGGGSGLFWNNLLSEFPNIDLTVVDLFDLRELNDFAHKRVHSSFQDALPTFSSNSFDLCTAIDLLEHLDTADGYRLLYEMQRVSQKTVAIYTPNGFLWQPPSPNNPYNAHVSGWQAKDLISFGFQSVLGHVGHKNLIGPYSRPKNNVRNPYLSYFAEKLGERLAVGFPRYAFAISAWMNSAAAFSIDQAR